MWRTVATYIGPYTCTVGKSNGSYRRQWSRSMAVMAPMCRFDECYRPGELALTYVTVCCAPKLGLISILY